MATRRLRIVLLWGAVTACVGAVMGLIAGVLYAFGGFLYELVTGTLNAGTILAFGALVGMPVIFATVGFVVGVLLGFIYTIVSAPTGGPR